MPAPSRDLTFCSPEARLEKAWECPAAFEAAAIGVVKAVSSHRVGREVFDVPNVAALIERLDAWFAFFEPAGEPDGEPDGGDGM
jgi:hypothetical protein